MTKISSSNQLTDERPPSIWSKLLLDYVSISPTLLCFYSVKMVCDICVPRGSASICIRHKGPAFIVMYFSWPSSKQLVKL